MNYPFLWRLRFTYDIICDKMHINLHISFFFCNFAAKLEWSAPYC